MARTPSAMPQLGMPAPDFRLLNTVDGRMVARDDFRESPGLLVMFICNHCPFVKHVRAELAQIGRDYAGRVAIVAISSNDAVAYPADGPDAMKSEAKDAGYVFPYLFDESQSVARAYQAACTPDFFLFDQGRKLVYRGQLDASRPGNGVAVTGEDLRKALNLLITQQSIPSDQRPSLGCNIKWKTSAV